MVANAGFYGLFDFTGLFVGAGVSKRTHGHFPGAGKRTVLQMLMLQAAEMEGRRYRSRAQREEAQALLEARAQKADIENFMVRRQNSVAAYSVMLAEI